MKNILVIEDNLNILRVIELALARFGYDVKVAHNGIEGMELLNDEFHFDLVISDIRMDGADGNQVAKFMKDNEKTHKTPIIALTHYIEDAESELFDVVLAKPFTMKDLISEIDSVF